MKSIRFFLWLIIDQTQAQPLILYLENKETLSFYLEKEEMLSLYLEKE